VVGDVGNGVAPLHAHMDNARVIATITRMVPPAPLNLVKMPKKGRV
jgi:hypothetical protein